MEQLVMLCLGALCLLTPIVFVLLSGGAYALGIGTLNLPGIARREMQPDKDWTTVPDLTRKAGETTAAVVSLLGTLFGLLGFLLPWVRVNIGAGSGLFDLGALNGTMSGIALAFQSLLLGFGLLTEDAVGVGIALIILSLFVSLIPLALMVSAATGVGLISIPLGLLKKFRIQPVARALLITSVVSLLLTCAFFVGIQATVGGLKVGGSENLLGSSFSLSVEVANGFWITVGGLVLALVGAIVANTLAASLAAWTERLTTLGGAAGNSEGESDTDTETSQTD